jgi:hypothetical protein
MAEVRDGRSGPSTPLRAGETSETGLRIQRSEENIVFCGLRILF